MIHLTPFAWRSGQTSSMLGGAQFKATLLAVKHLPAIYNAKRQIFLSQSKDGKQLFVAWSSQFSGAAHFFKFMYQGGQRQRTHSAGNYPLIGSPRTGSNIRKCKSMLCTYTAQTLPLNRIPTRQGRLTLVPFCWAWKVAQTFKKGEAKSERASQKQHLELQVFEASLLSLWQASVPKVLDETVWQQWIPDFWAPFPNQGPHRGLISTVEAKVLFRI